MHKQHCSILIGGIQGLMRKFFAEGGGILARGSIPKLRGLRGMLPGKIMKLTCTISETKHICMHVHTYYFVRRWPICKIPSLDIVMVWFVPSSIREWSCCLCYMYVLYPIDEMVYTPTHPPTCLLVAKFYGCVFIQCCLWYSRCVGIDQVINCKLAHVIVH